MSQENPPAFPCDWKDFQPDTGIQVVREQYQGMTLRDYFAAQVLVGFLSNPKHTRTTKAGNSEKFQSYMARRSYEIADAMLAERSKS